MKQSLESGPYPEELPLKEKQSTLRRRVFSLALPSLVELSLVMLVQMVDMIQVGGLGPWAIAAVGLANQPMFLVLSVFMGLSVGTTALVARFTGAGAGTQKSSTVVMQSLFITLAGAALHSLVTTALGSPGYGRGRIPWRLQRLFSDRDERADLPPLPWF